MSAQDRSNARGAESVYQLYRNDPESGAASYLHDHYRRGLAGIMEPSNDAHLAHAAWRAGRDTAALTGAERASPVADDERDAIIGWDPKQGWESAATLSAIRPALAVLRDICGNAKLSAGEAKAVEMLGWVDEAIAAAPAERAEAVPVAWQLRRKGGEWERPIRGVRTAEAACFGATDVVDIRALYTAAPAAARSALGAAGAFRAEIERIADEPNACSPADAPRVLGRVLGEIRAALAAGDARLNAYDNERPRNAKRALTADDK